MTCWFSLQSCDSCWCMNQGPCLGSSEGRWWAAVEHGDWGTADRCCLGTWSPSGWMSNRAGLTAVTALSLVLCSLFTLPKHSLKSCCNIGWRRRCSWPLNPAMPSPTAVQTEPGYLSVFLIFAALEMFGLSLFPLPPIPATAQSFALFRLNTRQALKSKSVLSALPVSGAGSGPDCVRGCGRECLGAFLH